MFRWATLAAVAAWGAGPVAAQDTPKALANQAGAILQKHCQRCHDGPGSSGGFEFDVRKPATLRAVLKPRKPVVVSGKPAESKVWTYVEKDRMPEDAPPLPDAEKAVLKKWIEAGAPDFVTRADRKFLSLEKMMAAVRDDLVAAKRKDRDSPKYRRYFTLTHLHNNNSVLDDQLGVYRAALSKALNSLSWAPDVVIPEPIDPEKTVFAVDVKKLDWDRNNLWQEVLNEYPYGLRYDRHPDSKPLRDLDEEIFELTGSHQPMLRADWFVATATRPPLYHTLMYDAALPALRDRVRDATGAKAGNPKLMNVRDLEHYLGLDVRANFDESDSDRIARAGFGKSGVSGQNRLLERHRIKNGAYWISYDFLPGRARSKLTRFPLGPLNLFPEGKHPYPRQAFIQDGGEIIFSLPNGMQGYLLIDGKGGRIDAGPIDVVSDGLKTAGTPAIVNGLSCMACHAQGMLPFTDEVRAGHTLLGFDEAARKVERLYPEKAVMDDLVARDRKRFLRAADDATDPFLKGLLDREKLGEPVGVVARRYRLEYLDLEAVACDVFEPDPAKLKAKLGDNKFRVLGLNVLTREGGLIGRLEWEAPDGLSLMQIVAESYGASPVKYK